jgi:hypothetical protein
MLHFCCADNIVAMVLRYLPEVQQHLTPPFPVWKHMRRNPYRKKKRQKKSIFIIYGTTFKKNESGRDFQRVQIWNDRSQKKKNYGRVTHILFYFFSGKPATE